MTPRQRERTVRQLLYRKRLAQSITSLEDRIKVAMTVEEKSTMRTTHFVIHLADKELSISVVPQHDPRQLQLHVKKGGNEQCGTHPPKHD